MDDLSEGEVAEAFGDPFSVPEGRTLKGDRWIWFGQIIATFPHRLVIPNGGEK